VPDVFINYLTGDEEGIATLIDQELVRRIGRERVFFASGSIGAGEDFTEHLLPAVRKSRVLLAVMGAGWLKVTDKAGRPKLHDANNWTHREIATALAEGVHVIPILVGRLTPRLNKPDLPADLHPLADRQAVEFDHRHREQDLLKLVRALSKLVPGLEEETVPAKSEQATNSAGNNNGVVFQAGDNAHQQSGGVFVGGNAGTVISESHGPIHTGKGNQYNGDSSFPRKGEQP
jgi:hypothetical protein